MKMKHWMFLIATVVFGWDAQTLQAQDSPNAESAVAAPASGRTAVIKQNRVNVRGRATINSEVVASLNQGDRVPLLEEITLKKPKPDEPDKWLRIGLPETAYVWVHSSFIDDQTKQVKATRLNLRGGPGENYSVLGQIEKGTTVQEVETKGSWLKIPAPTTAYAFVAAHLATIEDSAPPAIVAAPTTPTTETTGETVPPTPETEDIKEEAVATEPPVAVATETEAGATTNLTEVASEAPAEAPPAPEPEVAPEPPPKRIVTREGIVRRSVSIQAPTYFILESIQNRKTINYLHASSTNIALQDFYGSRILVTGEELLDERWPHTPVINIEKIESVP